MTSFLFSDARTRLQEQTKAAFAEATRLERIGLENAAKLKAEEDKELNSAKEVQKFLNATLEEGFENGKFNHKVVNTLLERSTEPRLLTMTWVNKLLSDLFSGVRLTDQGYRYQDATYNTAQELETAVSTQLGVTDLPNFAAILKGVVVNKTLMVSELKALDAPKPEAYDSSLLTSDDAAFVIGFNY